MKTPTPHSTSRVHSSKSMSTADTGAEFVTIRSACHASHPRIRPGLTSKSPFSERRGLICFRSDACGRVKPYRADSVDFVAPRAVQSGIRDPTRPGDTAHTDAWAEIGNGRAPQSGAFCKSPFRLFVQLSPFLGHCFSIDNAHMKLQTDFVYKNTII
jgi:hypothetical protein